MSYDFILPLLAFAFVTSITPGPNNLMLMASGANFGLGRTVPHMLGVGLGFVAMVSLVGMGLGQIFEKVPLAYTALLGASLLYLLWLAWKVATAAAPGEGRAEGRPLTFLQAAGFQWVNVKAWAMALTAITTYAPDGSLAAVLAVAAIFGAVNLPSVSVWVLLGREMRRFLTHPTRLHVFNYTMAALLVLSTVPMMLRG